MYADNKRNRNIFVFGIESQSGVNKALEENIWSFGPFPLVVQEYVYRVAPDSVNMDVITMWDHIPVNIGKPGKLGVNLFFEKLLKGFCKRCRVLNHPTNKCVTKHLANAAVDSYLEEIIKIEEQARFIEEQLEDISNAFCE